MSFPGGFPLVDRPSRSYAQVKSPPIGGGAGIGGMIGGVRQRNKDGEDVLARRQPRKNAHRPTQSTPNANANLNSYFPIQAPAPLDRSTMYLARAPPAPGVYENALAMESGLTLPGTVYSSQVGTVNTLTGAAAGGLGQGAGQRLGGIPVVNGVTGPNPDDQLVLPSMLPRGRSDGILPASSMQMQSLRPVQATSVNLLASTKPGAGGPTGKAGRLTGTRYHGPTLASPPIIMGTPGFGLSARDAKTGMTESERIKAAYLKAGPLASADEIGDPSAEEVQPGQGSGQEITSPRKKKKKKLVAQPGDQEQTAQSTQTLKRKASQSQVQDAFLAWPGHTSLGVLIPNNPSTANLPLPISQTVAGGVNGNAAGAGQKPSRRARTGPNGTDLETPQERRARIRERRERRARREAGLDDEGTGAAAGVGVDVNGNRDVVVGNGTTPRRSRTRRGTGDGMGGGEDGGGQGAGRMRLLRGASMRRANVWDEVPESNEQELPEGPPSFPYPTASTTRLPPVYQQAPSQAAGRPISPPPSFDTATTVIPVISNETSRPGGLETLQEGDEEEEAFASRPESPLSETASSIVPDNEAPALTRKRELRAAWVGDVQAGIGLDERLARERERQAPPVDEVPLSAMEAVTAANVVVDSPPRKQTPSSGLDASATLPEAIAGPNAQADSMIEEPGRMAETQSAMMPEPAAQPASIDLAPPLTPASDTADEDVDDDAPVIRYSKEEKGKGRAIEVACIPEGSRPDTPQTPDVPVGRPSDMESLAETHGSGSEADFASVKEGVSARTSEVQKANIVDLAEQVTPRKSGGWRQVDAEDATPTGEVGSLSDGLKGRDLMSNEPDEQEDAMEVLAPLEPPSETTRHDAFKGVSPIATLPLSITIGGTNTRPRGVSNASRISRNAAGSIFTEDLPEVTGVVSASPVSPIPIPPTPPSKDTPVPVMDVRSPGSPVGPRPLFKRGASDKAKSENPWAFMRRVSSGGKDRAETGRPEPVLQVSPLAVESPKRPQRTRKMSKLATQLFKPTLGLPAEPTTTSPEKGSTKSPSIASSDEEDGVRGGTVIVTKPRNAELPSRLAALARRDLLAPVTVKQPAVKPAVRSDSASTTTAPYIHPFNRAVKPAWMIPAAKFNLPAALDPMPSRSYAPQQKEDLEAKLGWISSAQSPPDTNGVYQFVPPPSWPVISEAVIARRRAPPAIPVKASPEKDGSSSDDDSGSDSDDGSSSYEWSISDVVPRRSGAYRLLPPKGLPAEVLRGPAEPHPHYRSGGDNRIRPRGPRDRGVPPALPPRQGASANNPAVAIPMVQPQLERRPPPPLPVQAAVPQFAIEVPIEKDWSLVDSPLFRPPIERQLTANEKILATLIPSERQPKPKVETALPSPTGEPAQPTKRKISMARTKESSPAPAAPPPARQGRLIIKARIDDRPEQEMQSQLSRRVNKWRVMAIDAEVDNLIQEAEPDSEPERPVIKIAPPSITHSRSAPNLSRLQAGRTSDPASSRPGTLPGIHASRPGVGSGGATGQPTQEPRDVEAGPSNPKDLEYTDLDLAVARATENGREFEAFGEVTSFLENAGRGATADELTDLLVAPVELESRRTTKDGKVKLKLAALGVRVTKCAICQLQYKEGHMLAMMPGCGHTGHQKCVVGWLRSDARCMICRQPLRS